MTYPLSEAFGLESPLLSEISTKDQTLNVLKRRALKTSNLFAVAADWYQLKSMRPVFSDWSYKIKNCCTYLTFRLTDDGLKLQSANFCKVRLCPLCTVRKSRIWFAKGQRVLPAIDDYRLLFLTLTVRNCPVDILSSVSRQLSHSFANFIRSLKYYFQDSYKGYIRSFECTRSSSRFAHPHYHIIFAVTENYFSDYYLSFPEWKQLWMRSTNNDGMSIHLKAVPQKQSVSAFLELLKYELKPHDFTDDWLWLAEYSLQVHGLQKFSKSGVFRETFKFLDESSDLLHGADTQQKFETLVDDIKFRWNSDINQYQELTAWH